MTGLSSVYGLVGVNSKCGVQSKRKCKSHESCICIAGFSACRCQKKSVVYKTECRHVAVQTGKQDHNLTASQLTPFVTMEETTIGPT